MASLKNGKLFFWHINCPLPGNGSAAAQHQQGNDAGEDNIHPLEVIDLAHASSFVADATEMCGRRNSIFMELTRPWSACDVSSALQKIVGNMIVRQLFISVDNATERTEWSKMLKIVIDSHQEWKK